MKVAALAHFSLPFRNCGSEVVIHELLKAAAQAGHDVTMWCTHQDARRSWRGNEPPVVFDGVKIVRVRNAILGSQQVKAWKPDVVVSHHDHVTLAIKAAKLIGARSVFLTHNDYALNARPLRADPDLVIHNSQHVADTLAQYGTPREQMIFHPPLTPDRHTVPSTGDALTLINLNRDKGAELFYKLAETMPERKFVGVIGGHGEQIICRRLPNVEILDHGPDMQRVWSRTRVLLMPSEFESYGLTAVEAGINGIPTIAHPTTGLRENLGPDGIFADRDAPSEWVSQISNLEIGKNYERASKAATALADAAMRDTQETLSKWLNWL